MRDKTPSKSDSNRTRSQSFRSRRAAVALDLYRWGCRAMLAFHLMVLMLREHNGLTNIGPPLAAIIFFDIPSTICGCFGKGGCIAVATEIVLNEVFHLVTFGVLIPLYLAFYLPISTVELTRWVLVKLAFSTTLRAYLCHIKVLNKLSPTSMLPHLITPLPFYFATIYRLAWDQAILEEHKVTLQICLVIHGFNVLLHHHKVVGMEELAVSLLATLADRAVLLRSAFDATCDVRVLPMGPSEPKSGKPLALAGRLQVLRSSNEMDALFCCSMGSEILDFQRVTSGLPNLTEIVMRALDPANDPVLNRALVTIRDGLGFELDCEVRAVAGGQSSDGAVLCGLRQIGEKREILREEDAAAEAAEAPRTCASPCVGGETSGGSQLSAGERVMHSLAEFWAFLRADPEPEQLPSTQAVFRALRSVGRLLWVECDVNSFEITKASPAALQEFPAPVLGRTVPTLLVSGSSAQKLRKALHAFSDIPWADLLATGYHSKRFRDVAVRLSGGPSVPVVVHLILMPAPTATQPPVLVLVFDRLPISSLRSVTAQSVQSSEVDSVSQAGVLRRLRGGRTLNWAGKRNNR